MIPFRKSDIFDKIILPQSNALWIVKQLFILSRKVSNITTIINFEVSSFVLVPYYFVNSCIYSVVSFILSFAVVSEKHIFLHNQRPSWLMHAKKTPVI